MELRDVRLSNERTFSLFERHSDGTYTLSQRPRVDSNSTSHCKKGYAPKWKESRSLHASLIQGRNKLTC